MKMLIVPSMVDGSTQRMRVADDYIMTLDEKDRGGRFEPIPDSEPHLPRAGGEGWDRHLPLGPVSLKEGETLIIEGDGNKRSATYQLTGLTLANIRRNAELDPEGKCDVLFHAVALGGEAGEALNDVKKLVRERLGLRGSRSTRAKLAKELADVVISASLVAILEEIDLNAAIQEKFNEDSAKMGATTVLLMRGI